MVSFIIGGKRVVLRFGFAMMLLIAFLLSGKEVLPCLVCCMLHECGHLLCCHLLRLPVRELEFGCSGLNLKLFTSPELLSIPKALLLHGSGILSNLLFAGLFLLFGMVWEGFFVWAAVSVSLALFHLIPANALDGGRVWRLLSERFLPLQWQRQWEILGDFLAFAVFAALAAMAFSYDQPLFAVAIALAAVGLILPQ